MSDDDDDFDLDITYSVGRELGIQSSASSAPHPNKPAAAAAAAATIDDDDVTASEEDDDLDYIPPIKKPRVTAPPQDAPPPTTKTQTRKTEARKQYSESEEEEEEQDEEPVRTTLHPSGGGGERIIMTDASSDDEVLANFKWRRAERLSKGDKTKKRTTTDKASSGTTAKRLKSISTSKIPPKSKRVQTWKYSGDEGEAADTATQHERKALPSYLQGKKARLDRAKKGLEEGKIALDIFRVPPSYEDIEFSDGERVLESLETRPKIDNPPSAPYTDIYLEESLGVIPSPIAQYLRSYQVDGAKFLHRSFVFQEGCILGDDMGLGKTVQVIAFLTAAFGKTGDERDGKRMRKIRQFRRRTGEDRWYPKALVICPSSLIKNWENELRTWGWWTVYVYHGSKEEKEIALQAAKKGSLEIMITNYETYRTRHADINMVNWDCVIADECHKIKEKTSEITQRMNDINSLCRIGLTGTAIQNNYGELWTLLNWCRPGSLGTALEWERTIAGPLRVGQRHDATFAQIGKARSIALKLVNNLLPRMFMRRMKTLIAHQLPKKTDKVVFCPLTETQRDAYEAYLDSPVVQLIRDGSDECDCGTGKKRRSCCYKNDAEGRKVNELVFPAIMWVQKLSNHLANWIPDNTESSEVQAQKLELLQTCLPNRWRELSTRERIYNYMDPQMCGKWLVLQRLLQFWHQNGDKVLIFSYSLNLLYILHTLFQKTEYNVCYLDGQMPLQERSKAVDDFNNDLDQFVFLISTKTGGVGLNITAANKVVIFDPNWNPSYDLQAQDRAYRIGQTRDVEVFRLISSGTIEEIVYARQIYKQQQANIGYDASEERRYFTGVQGDKDNKGELFGLKNLFNFQENTILQGIVNKTNIAERRAGVMVADLDVDTKLEDTIETLLSEDEAEGGVLHALSQLADDLPIITKKKKPPQQSEDINVVAAILAEAGISYTHENSEVIGTSKVEAEISRRAMESTKDTSTGGKKAFDEAVEKRMEYKFRPPVDVRKRQFFTMSKMFGFESPLEFALVVEGWTPEQRRTALEKFYRMRREGKEKLEIMRKDDGRRGDVKMENVEGTKEEGMKREEAIMVSDDDDDDDEL